MKPISIAPELQASVNSPVVAATTISTGTLCKRVTEVGGNAAYIAGSILDNEDRCRRGSVCDADPELAGRNELLHDIFDSPSPVLTDSTSNNPNRVATFIPIPLVRFKSDLTTTGAPQ